MTQHGHEGVPKDLHEGVQATREVWSGAVGIVHRTEVGSALKRASLVV